MNNSAKRVLEILELFSEAASPLTISDIQKALGYPKTSVFDIVNVLAEQGFIRRENERAKTYVIGVKAYQVGMSYLKSTNLYAISHPIIQRVCETLGETCYLAVEQNGFVIYLDKVESSSPIRSTCAIGAKNHMYLTGLGKAMLAGYEETRVREIAAMGMSAHTDTTITDADALVAECAKIREEGCAYDIGEDNPHVRCAAAPIRDASGQVIAAISVAMLDAHFTDEMKQAAKHEIVAAAMEISRQSGYRGVTLY